MYITDHQRAYEGPGEEALPAPPPKAAGKLWHVEDGSIVAGLHPGQAQAYMSERSIVAIVAGTQGGKALALDTPVPTAHGWSTMGDLQVGDYVLDEGAHPVRVRYTSPVFQDHPCYELTFSDGATVVADADHLWKVRTEKQRRPNLLFDQSSTLSTHRIADSLQANYSIRRPNDKERFITGARRVPSVPTRCISVEGQSKLYLCTRNYIPTHNTSFGPLWLEKEIGLRGPGDYLAVSTTVRLSRLKMVPEFLKLFDHALNLGTWHKGDRFFELHPDRAAQYFDNEAFRSEPTRIIFGSAVNPDSLESATAKAAWLDEAGQKWFRLESWEAVRRRLTLNRGRVLISTTPYCFDPETEIYTRRGWVRFLDLQETDEVMACTADGKGHFERPLEIISQRYTGPMVQIRGGRIDLLVTPNHRVLYRSSGHNFVKSAEHFSGLKHRGLSLPKTVDVDDSQSPTEFVLPGVDIGHGNRWGRPAKYQKSADVAVPMKDWCAFMGWYLTEGSSRSTSGGKIHHQQYQVVLAQNPGLKRDHMRADLARLPFLFRETKVGFEASNKQLWSYLHQFGAAESKFVPAELKVAGRDDLRVLIDRMILGDGSYRTNRQGEFTFYSTSKRLAEDFREVCMLAGLSTHIAERKQKGGAYIRGRLINSTRPIYHVTERRRRAAMVDDCRNVPYDGWVHCVRVSTGFVLVRRNGEEVISGNSLGWLYVNVYQPWLAGDPNIEVISFSSDMNPAFPKEAMEEERGRMPAWRFNLFYLARFEKPEGLIYGAYSDLDEPDGMVVEPFEIPQHWPVFVGVDFGGANTATVWMAMNPESQRFYIFHESLGGGKTSAQHAEEFRRVAGFRPVIGVYGGSASEEQHRRDWRTAGIPIKGPPMVRDRDGRESVLRDVEVGIERTRTLMISNRFRVFRNCVGVRAELGDYSRVLLPDGTPTDQIDDKAKFHRLDALRYVSQHLYRFAMSAVGVLAQTSAVGWQPR